MPRAASENSTRLDSSTQISENFLLQTPDSGFVKVGSEKFPSQNFAQIIVDREQCREAKMPDGRWAMEFDKFEEISWSLVNDLRSHQHQRNASPTELIGLLAAFEGLLSEGAGSRLHSAFSIVLATSYFLPTTIMYIYISAIQYYHNVGVRKGHE